MADPAKAPDPNEDPDLPPTSPTHDEQEQQTRRVVEIRRLDSVASNQSTEDEVSTASAANVVMRRPPLSVSPRPRSLILTMDHRRSPYFLTHSPMSSYESSEFYSFVFKICF